MRTKNCNMESKRPLPNLSGLSTSNLTSLPPELITIIALFGLDDGDFCQSNPIGNLGFVNKLLKQWNTDDNKLIILKNVARNNKLDDLQHLYYYNWDSNVWSYWRGGVFGEPLDKLQQPIPNDWKRWYSYLEAWCRIRTINKMSDQLYRNNLLRYIIASMVNLGAVDLRVGSTTGSNTAKFVHYVLSVLYPNGPIRSWRFEPVPKMYEIVFEEMHADFPPSMEKAPGGLPIIDYMGIADQKMSKAITQYFLTALLQWKGTENIGGLSLQFTANDINRALDHNDKIRTNWDVFISGFVDPSFFSGLKQLDLYMCNINDKCMDEFSKYFAAGHLPALQSLILNNNKIGDEGIQHFADACVTRVIPTKLTNLQLTHNRIGPKGLDALHQAMLKGALDSLSILLSDQRPPEFEQYLYLKNVYANVADQLVPDDSSDSSDSADSSDLAALADLVADS